MSLPITNGATFGPSGCFCWRRASTGLTPWYKFGFGKCLRRYRPEGKGPPLPEGVWNGPAGRLNQSNPCSAAVHPFYREEGRNDRTLSKHDQHSSQKERVWISLLCFGGDGVAYQHAVSSAGPGGKRGGLLPAAINAGGDCGNKGTLGRMSKRLDV